VRIWLSVCALVVPLVAALVPATAAVDRVAVTTDELVSENGVGLRQGWRYRPGDDPAWALPGLDDSTWEILDSPRLWAGSRPASGWPGIGWFRLHLDVDPALGGTPIALRLIQSGASEIYVDGRLAHSLGRVAASAAAERTYDPKRLALPVVFERGGEHVIAVRYSCMAGADEAMSLGRALTAGTRPVGFLAWLEDAQRAATDYDRGLLFTTIVTMAFIGVLTTVGLLHLFLFFFDRRQRANLFYSLFALCFALNVTCALMLGVGHLGYEPAALVAAGKPVALAGMFVFYLAFLHSAFRLTIPKYYWAILAPCAVVVVVAGVAPWGLSQDYAILGCLVVSAGESIRLLARALAGKLDGVWIIGAGVLSYAAALTIELVANMLDVPGHWSIQVLETVGYLGLPLCVSVYLARAFARTSRELEAKLSEVATLSAEAIEHARREADLRAENERKARELEEARELQLSMLPASVPELPGLEIAAYMKPATEVGGDYYDFHVATDGTLTVAVGDATGHGLKAGTLVTATKGLFNALVEEPDIARFFHQSSSALKRLNLRYLYMALMMAKVNGTRVRLSAAGMPPTLVFRAATGEVEEVAIQGLPLGGGARFPYKERVLELSSSDVVVFMSDGFPERFNAMGEMLDYERARSVLAESAHGTAHEIIEHFVRAGDAWADGHPQNDDVTFVVLKVREKSPS
jgi:serine phosphatase RsbU (regulator of sigma subunit)